jgi:hypothetical protein
MVFHDTNGKATKADEGQCGGYVIREPVAHATLAPVAAPSRPPSLVGAIIRSAQLLPEPELERNVA